MINPYILKHYVEACERDRQRKQCITTTKTITHGGETITTTTSTRSDGIHNFINRVKHCISRSVETQTAHRDIKSSQWPPQDEHLQSSEQSDKEFVIVDYE